MNSVILTGKLTKDPELRYIPESQNAVATFSIAVDRAFSKEKKADFIKITVFGKQAENCERFTAKGKLVGVQGRLQTGSYKNKEGATVYTTDVVADRVEFLEWGEKQSGFKPEDENQDHGIPEGFQALEDDDIPFK
jgi:single-strand DNA-binding protein